MEQLHTSIPCVTNSEMSCMGEATLILCVLINRRASSLLPSFFLKCRKHDLPKRLKTSKTKLTRGKPDVMLQSKFSFLYVLNAYRRRKMKLSYVKPILFHYPICVVLSGSEIAIYRGTLFCFMSQYCEDYEELCVLIFMEWLRAHAHLSTPWHGFKQLKARIDKCLKMRDKRGRRDSYCATTFPLAGIPIL